MSAVQVIRQDVKIAKKHRQHIYALKFIFTFIVLPIGF